MKDNFQRALEFTLRHEGGFSNHPADPGGETYKGITLDVFRRHFGADKTVNDLKRLSDEEIAAIYKKDYWDQVNADELPDGLDLLVFDYAVNSGPHRAVSKLQNIVGTVPDGELGPITLKAVEGADDRKLIADYALSRLYFVQGLGTWATFGKGWDRRILSALGEAYRIVADRAVA